MPTRVICIALLTSLSLLCGAMADEKPARRTVRAELKATPAYVFNAGPNGEPQRWSIDNVVATTPPEIAEAVGQWTGISDRGKSTTVSFVHVPAKGLFTAMSSGDTGSVKTSAKRGDVVLEQSETHVRYKAAFAASDETTFSVFGILEFENRVTERKCYVTCQIDGEKPAAKDPQDTIIHPTGTVTWSGPYYNASIPLFVEDDAVAKK